MTTIEDDPNDTGDRVPHNVADCIEMMRDEHECAGDDCWTCHWCRELERVSGSLRDRLVPGDQVRLHDGREGTIAWVIPSGEEAAIILPGVHGTYHIHPRYLTKLRERAKVEL